jgi:hypothetical protein
MAKGYIINFVKAGTQDSPRNDIVFGSRPEDAWYWDSAERAEIDCLDLKRGGVKIQSMQGRIHLIYDFEVEETSPGKFSVFCDLPFIGQ